ncbi:hypothetical protein CC1G_13936 [Coprinopsis cinerea okayama7|uniref:Origin recognition complex subunit 5 n=1 Tax=Coprinopsis cinerea (strain Okayama-7 / 130 / ATCC MYA-4618 / FGSC 9003) TaxID=240176 RepID=D6RKP4_COPC7|nr:hypothetical protein CC1G_13936 [Coprinopsis cinerea okayama7\|eukprot:XP_002911896.1 hypothetical protein CC1G_13936 [Coprinopsis cinerea okayama7\
MHPAISRNDFELPGYDHLTLELSTLISGYPPPFIYIHDPASCEVTTRVVRSLLNHLEATPSSELDIPAIAYGRADAICCLSQRCFYESLIHTLVDWQPDWEDGCANWGSEGDLRWNENMDTFLQGIRASHNHIRGKLGLDSAKKGLRLVFVVEGVERLKETMPEVLVPLTRLQELSQLDVCVVFVSQAGWDTVKPPLAAAPDPYFIDIMPPRKESTALPFLQSQLSLISHQAIAQMLITRFPTIYEETGSTLYHPALQVLYSQFATVVCDVCYVFTHDPQELQYIAAARWPGFIRPVLDNHQRKLEELQDTMQLDEDNVPPFEAPSEEERLRLIRLFTPSLTAAVESLYPRLMNAVDWAKSNMPERDLLTMPPALARVQVVKPGESALANTLGYLPRMSKFILVASFLASTNPPKSDLRMFGRGTDEKKRRRRPTQATGKSKSGVSKVSQRLVGPSPFPMDRLVAILGALLEENDADSRLATEEFAIPGEYTDMEISRRSIHSSVSPTSTPAGSTDPEHTRAIQTGP